jgi:hypothetical protein
MGAAFRWGTLAGSSLVIGALVAIQPCAPSETAAESGIGLDDQAIATVELLNEACALVSGEAAGQ